MPAPRDDLEILGDDNFSSLIRSAYSAGASGNKKFGGGVVGFARIDKAKIIRSSKGFLNGNPPDYIFDFLKKSGGSCTEINSVFDRKLICEVVKKWRLTNIGAGGNNPNWADLAIKLVYTFCLMRTLFLGKQ